MLVAGYGSYADRATTPSTSPTRTRPAWSAASNLPADPPPVGPRLPLAAHDDAGDEHAALRRRTRRRPPSPRSSWTPTTARRARDRRRHPARRRGRGAQHADCRATRAAQAERLGAARRVHVRAPSVRCWGNAATRPASRRPTRTRPRALGHHRARRHRRDPPGLRAQEPTSPPATRADTADLDRRPRSPTCRSTRR